MKLVTPGAARAPFSRWPWRFRSPVALIAAEPACSFCGKTQHDGRVIVAGDAAAICDLCTERAAVTIAKALGQSPAGRQNAANVLFRPKEHQRFRRVLSGE